jgi:hypothetical protein
VQMPSIYTAAGFHTARAASEANSCPSPGLFRERDRREAAG